MYICAHTHTHTQLIESLLVALVDLSAVVVPALIANPEPHLGRLLDLRAEVTGDMQNEVGALLRRQVI